MSDSRRRNLTATSLTVYVKWTHHVYAAVVEDRLVGRAVSAVGNCPAIPKIQRNRIGLRRKGERQSHPLIPYLYDASEMDVATHKLMWIDRLTVHTQRMNVPIISSYRVLGSQQIHKITFRAVSTTLERVS